MIPSSFTYQRAGSAAEACDLAAEYGEEAKYLAGGHSLLPLMKLRLAAPEVLIDLGGLRDLCYLTDRGSHVAIGALTRHHDVEHSDLPAALLALDATFVVRGPSGTRTVPASEFFKGIFETALEPGELLTEIQVPKPAAPGAWSFQKFTKRAIDWAIVGVAVQGHAVALVNMGSTPLRATAVENALASGASIADAAALAAEGTSAGSDINASKAYRELLARVLVKRALEEAAARS